MTFEAAKARRRRQLPASDVGNGRGLSKDRRERPATAGSKSVGFGGTGYVALYEIVSASEVVVLAVRDQREEDYH